MVGPYIGGTKLFTPVARGDRVRTPSGRHGRVIKVSAQSDMANVYWDNGEQFSIRLCYLTLEEDTVSVVTTINARRPFGEAMVYGSGG